MESSFCLVPIESMVYKNQKEYYAPINRSNEECEFTAFIEFMLSVITPSRIEVIDEQRSERWDSE